MRLDELLKAKFDLSLSLPLPAGERLDRRELAASDMIPYSIHYDDWTVATKGNALVQIVKLDGLYHESRSPEQIKQYERRRNTVLRAIASSDRGLYVHVVRRKIDVYPAGSYENWFAHYLNERLHARHRERSVFVNEIYISVVRNRFRYGVPGWIDRVVARVTGNKADATRLETFEEQAKDLYSATNLLVRTLAEYGARRLGIVRSEEGASSEIGRFLHYLINLEDVPVRVTDQPLAKSLAVSRLNFGREALEVDGLGHRRVGAMVSMAEWPERTKSEKLDEFLRLPIEFVLTQSFFFIDRISAEKDMKQQRDRMEHANDVAASQIDEIREGLNELGAGRSVNGLHHLSILVHVPVTGGAQASLAKLDAAVDELKKGFVGLGVTGVRERYGLETFFWSQLPGQAQHLIGRRGRIQSQNFAGFASLHNFATGKLDGNLWGPAIMVLETESGTAYFFNLHRESEGMVAGHTAVTADTGSGKTLVVAVIVCQADKARPRVFWFDNKRGAEVFMRAMGGRHTVLTLQRSTGWNPLQLPDTPENRTYLIELFSLMRTCYGGTVSPDDMKRFHAAIEENYAFTDLKDRRLRNIAWRFGEGELQDAMRLWYGDGANAACFDNETDNIDLAACRHYCYEMGELIRDGVARPELAVVLSYPFHRISQAMNGEPFILVLEEGQNLVTHAYWRDKIDAYIMQIRRKNGVLIFVTPDPKYLYCETDSIKKQTATKIFLANSNAVRRDYVEELGLTQAEYEFIRDTPPESRKLLIRRGRESVKAIFDLSDMPDLIPVLSSNEKGVNLMHEIMEELGTDAPQTWVPVFMKRAMAAGTHNLTLKERKAS